MGGIPGAVWDGGRMRLIDAEAYSKKVCTYNETGCGSCDVQTICPFDEPTVDAVPVVRCKDCKYRDEQSANCTRFRKDWYVQSNSFCAWAERKEE